MGTNYYYRWQTQQDPPQWEEIHVGKQSAGWSFHFRGHPADLAPGEPAIDSRTRWVRFMNMHPGALRNEYGTETPDPAIWVQALPAPTTHQRAKEADMIPGWVRMPDRDAEGFYVDYEEFC